MEASSSNTEQNDSIVSGYVHNVSPIKISKKNTRYFNATLQVSRDKYHHTVVFGVEKHNSFDSAAKKKTPIKMKNVKKSISFKDKGDFDIQCLKHTTIEVTDITFPHKPPKDNSCITIEEIQAMTSNHLITKLEASVYTMEICNSTVTIKENDCEVNNCSLADSTGMISLSLWDDQIKLVNSGSCYMFTNLTTRKYNDKVTLTTTRSTTITPTHKKLTMPKTTDETQTPPPTLTTVTTDITGASLTVKKQCPKCHAAQYGLTKDCAFHRCTTCKILRKGTTYITKCSGFLTIDQENEELPLTITNSLLTKFMNIENDINAMDSQDVEEYFMSNGPLTLTYTNNSQIIDLQKPKPSTPEVCNSDEELTSIIIDDPEKNTQTPEMHEENMPKKHKPV